MKSWAVKYLSFGKLTCKRWRTHCITIPEVKDQYHLTSYWSLTHKTGYKCRNKVRLEIQAPHIVSIITCLHKSIVHCCILLHNRSFDMFYFNCIALSILTLCCVFISFQGISISANILFGLILCSCHFLQILDSFIRQYFPSCPCTFHLILEFFVFHFCHRASLCCLHSCNII